MSEIDTRCELRKPINLKSGTEIKSIIICHGDLEFVGYLKSEFYKLRLSEKRRIEGGR